MQFDELKQTILGLSLEEKKRLLMEVMPEL